MSSATADRNDAMVRAFLAAWERRDTIRDGRIAAWREYFDPALFAGS